MSCHRPVVIERKGRWLLIESTKHHCFLMVSTFRELSTSDQNKFYNKVIDQTIRFFNTNTIVVFIRTIVWLVNEKNNTFWLVKPLTYEL